MSELVAVDLWMTGERKKIQQAYIMARTINPQLKTVDQCEKQLSRWHSESIARGQPADTGSDPNQSPQDQICETAVEGIALFDDVTLLLLKVLADLEFDIKRGSGDDSAMVESLTKVVEGMVSLAGYGVNPFEVLQEALEELRSVCIDQDGNVTQVSTSKIMEACNNVLPELQQSNVVRDLTRLV